MSGAKFYGAPGTRMRAYELAEQVALLFGWTGVAGDTSDRALALEELWQEWYQEFQRSGGNPEAKGHPELSDARIAELAARRRETRARTLAEIEKLIATTP